MVNLKALNTLGPPFVIEAGFTIGRAIGVSSRSGLGLATIHARNGMTQEIARRARERLAVDLPQGPTRASAGEWSLMGTGPRTWLASHESGAAALDRLLREALGNLASIADQSDAYAVLRVTGEGVRDLLMRLVPLDVHTRAFPVGSVALTVAAQVRTMLWRLHDSVEGFPTFEIGVPRSFAVDFWQMLLDCSQFLQSD